VNLKIPAALLPVMVSLVFAEEKFRMNMIHIHPD